MTDLTSFTLAQARDALRKKEFSAIELTEAHLAVIERAHALNAFVRETPERSRAMAQAAGRPIGQRRRRPARGSAARHQGSFLHHRCAHDFGLAYPRKFRAALRIHSQREPVARRRRARR